MSASRSSEYSTRCGEMVQGYQELIDRLKKLERRQDIESKEIWKAIRMLQQKAFE